MVTEVESGSAWKNQAYLILAVGILLASISSFYLFPESSTLLRALGVVGGVILSIIVTLQADAGKRIWAYFKETRTEIRKVVWPTRKETTQTTLIVVVMVILVGIFLWLIDMFFMWAVKLLTGPGG